MAKIRVKYANLDDTSIERDIFYYKKCNPVNRKAYSGARSDGEDIVEERKVLGLPPNWRKPKPTPPPRHVITMQCKMCVSVCCGNDCQCNGQLIPETSTSLQLEQSDCKKCVTMCCGDDCRCKEQLMQQSTTALPKREQKVEKEMPSTVTALPKMEQKVEKGMLPSTMILSKQTTEKDSNVLSLSDEGPLTSEILSSFPFMKLQGKPIITYKTPYKFVTYNMKDIRSGAVANLTQIFSKSASGIKLEDEHFVYKTSPSHQTNQWSGRRDLPARDYIKNVITHDEDINAILKDLVKVTLKKADMMRKMDTRRSKAVEYTDVEDSESDF